MAADIFVPTRRAVLLGSGALFAGACLPRIADAEDRDPRFLAIVLRGGLDGLAVVAPVGDPDWRKLRGDKALTLDGPSPALPLDDSPFPARLARARRWVPTNPYRLEIKPESPSRRVADCIPEEAVSGDFRHVYSTPAIR
jgi:hypothetical protein